MLPLPARMTNGRPAWTWSLRPVFLSPHTLRPTRPAPHTRSPGHCRQDGGNKAGSERPCRRPAGLQVPALPYVPPWHVEPCETFQWTEASRVIGQQRTLTTLRQTTVWMLGFRRTASVLSLAWDLVRSGGHLFSMPLILWTNAPQGLGLPSCAFGASNLSEFF